MAINTHVPLRTFFYPLGNTPAVNLLRDHYAYQTEAVKILCLACGDVRNIFFTLWSENAHHVRHFDFTTCDLEPGILARNILLFATLIEDDTKTDHRSIIWNLYHHLFITTDAITFLRAQAIKLFEYSASEEAWYRSPYGKHLKFLDEDTMFEVRRYWQLYGDSNFDCERDYRQGVRENLTEDLEHEGIYGARSAGLHLASSVKVMGQALRRFWETGVVAGNEIDALALQGDNGGHINPLFKHSSAAFGKFDVHYGTDPLLGYHLAEAFDDRGSTSERLERVSQVAKRQFKVWCNNFVEVVRSDAVTISFCCAEAVGLCYGLQEVIHGYSGFPKMTYPYQRPWTSRILRLNGVSRLAPYDVIDTSNVSDSVGILNLLPATRPLLSRLANSVLYTETLLPRSDDLTQYFDELLKTDVESFSTIAGIAPTCCVLGTSTEPYGSELSLNLFKSRKRVQFRCRYAWQRPLGGDAKTPQLDGQSSPIVEIDFLELAQYFAKWYLRIFAPSENLANQFSTLHNSPQEYQSLWINPYSRITVVSLFNLAKGNVISDWPRCIDAFLSLVELDRSLIVGNSSLLDLFTSFHLSGLHSVPTLTQTPQTAASICLSRASFPMPSCLSRFAELPRVVHVVLKVPRSKLHVFASADPGRVGTPGLRVTFYQDGVFNHSFSTIHACFGKVHTVNDGAACSIEEDRTGWQGQSDLIVTCVIPTFQLLLAESRAMRVALVVNNYPGMVHFVSMLGLLMRVYSTSVDDSQNLHVFSRPPNVAMHQVRSFSGVPDKRALGNPTITVTTHKQLLSLFTARASMFDDAERSLITSGCQIQCIQESACTVTLKFGPCKRSLHFHAPVNGGRSRTRVSRKNCWIEVTVPISLATQPYGYGINHFPVLASSGGPAAWGMSRINLDRQPIIQADAHLPSLNAFLVMAFSRREKGSRGGQAGGTEYGEALVQLRESLSTMFQNVHGHGVNTPVGPGGVRVFMLSCDGDSDTVIVVNALRHDNDTGSICLDAHVVPMDGSRVEAIHPLLCRASMLQQALCIKVSKDEEVLWKQLLPSIVERCRVTWEHEPECRYTIGSATFTCPRSLSHGKIPICSCGEGKDVAIMAAEYRDLGPYATRIAIPIISAVPFVEPLRFMSVLE